MVEPKWTKEPWAVIDEGGLVCGRDSKDPTKPSFDIFNAEEWPGDEEEAMADAHLIGAAPNLYHALESLLSAVAHIQQVPIHRLNEAQEALRKARGESGDDQ